MGSNHRRIGYEPTALPTELHLERTEGVGFEPTEVISLARFQGGCLKPLDHPSIMPTERLELSSLSATASKTVVYTSSTKLAMMPTRYQVGMKRKQHLANLGR